MRSASITGREAWLDDSVGRDIDAGEPRDWDWAMTSTLHEISVLSYRQTLGAAAHFLGLGQTHCAASGIDPETLVEARLIADMLPLRFQVQSIVHHSVGAVAALRSGHFAPPHGLAALDYAGLMAIVAEAQATMQGIEAAEIDALAGREVVFAARGVERHFTAEGFILSFSLPNLHFHAATAYGILRMQGVPVGKRDFMGQMRLKADG